MSKIQKFLSEMLVRVREFGEVNKALFPEGSKASEALARVASALKAVEEHQKGHLAGKAGARIKRTTRQAMQQQMKAVAKVARRVTNEEPSAGPFRMTRKRNMAAQLATARAFLDAVTTRQEAFARFGLPATFITDFELVVKQVQEAEEARLESKNTRRRATAGIEAALKDGLAAVLDLDGFVTAATQRDPATYAVWVGARRTDQVARPADSPSTQAGVVATTPTSAPAPSSSTSSPAPTAPGDDEVVKAS